MVYKSLPYCNGNTDLKDELFKMISVNAYYRAEKRGFEPGHEEEDWYQAESEIISIYRYWFLRE